MADNFGLKIGVEGEKEFKNSLREINQYFKVLGSEMKLVSSEFDKNDKSIQAVSARNVVLNKSIDAQKEKITTLESALQNASDSFGENDKRTQNWAIQLNNAKAQLNGMERELAINEKALDSMGQEEVDVTKETDNLGNELKDTGAEAEKSGGKFEKFGGVLKGIGAAMGAVALAAGAAAIELGKQVVSAYADYEQLVGGVDTLFGDASKTVQKSADNAFKTAGMSANEYMETVTGFSASLIQSLNGDTAKAAGVADQAITDMSDNANKMGSNMSDIQNAYQGFAKQNYTMLDNLKLGGPNRLAQSKPCENGETLNASRRRQYRAKYENLTWKKITQNPNYSINQNGVIRNDNTNQLKQPYVNQNTGYLIVDLWENNRGKKYSVHRLVAETFISNPACKPTVDHIDGDRQNNSVENLRWATYSEQNSRFGTVGVRSEEIVVKHYEERRKNRGGGHIEWLSVSEVLRFSSISEAADYFDCTLGNISQMLKVGTIGRRGLMRGYQFMYQTSRKTHKSVTTIETEQRFA